MSRLLVLLPSPITTLDTGARIRNAGLIKALAQDHHVETLIAPQRKRSLARRVRDMAVSELPDMAQRLWSEDVARVVRESDYDAVQAEGIEMARYLLGAPPERRIYDAHNAEFLLQQRLAQSSTGIASAYSRIQSQRLRRFEGAIVRGSRLTLAVSEHDANQLLALSGRAANVHVVPNAIEVAAYPFRLSTHAQPNLLYLGKLDFRPNAEALRWFLHEVMPGLPQARVFAVGAAPPRWLVRTGQHDPRVAVTGYVADERPYFARCAALIIPARTGGGSRLKALVAMACGVPVVSTRLGMEGLEAEPSVHFLQADTRAEWLDALRRLPGDAQLRRFLACNARDLVQQRYDWPAMRPRLHAAYAWLHG